MIEALLRHAIPYFGTPRRLLSDSGREFISEIWTKLLRSLGIQQILTFTYHPEGNAINERSHRTLNNTLRARLLEGPSSKAWVDKVPEIMLNLNTMPHEPHGFSASMIATGREPTLPPDLHLIPMPLPLLMTPAPMSRPLNNGFNLPIIAIISKIDVISLFIVYIIVEQSFTNKLRLNLAIKHKK